MLKISRRTVLRLSTGLVSAPAVLRGRFRLFAQSPVEYSSRAIRVMEEATVVDLLNQFMFPHLTEQPPKIIRWLQEPGSFTAADRALYQGSGIDVFALGAGSGSFDAGIRFFAQWNGFLAAYTDELIRIDDARDFGRAHRERKIGIMLTMQDSTHFRTAGDVDLFSLLANVSRN